MNASDRQVAFRNAGLKFVERCASAPATAAVKDFLSIIKQFGFSAAAGGAWVGVGKNRHNRFFFLHWPNDWVDQYRQLGGFEHDLIPIEARRRMTPFTWSEIRQGKLTPAQQALSEAGFAYGWREVFAVPIHGPGNLQGLVSMATRRERSYGAVDFAVLETMARTVWNCCRAAEGFGVAASERVHLRPREIECLQWAAAGKTDAEIASLASISPATAHFHIEQAKKRLGVKTRVEAVALGLLHGLV